MNPPKKENAIQKIKTKKEDLVKLVSDMENLNSEHLTKMKSSESKLLELEATLDKQSQANSLSTKTHSSESTSSQPEDTGCPDQTCFLRQPSYQSPSPGQKILNIPPPSNIRLLPRTVHSFEVFRSLQTSHECEE